MLACFVLGLRIGRLRRAMEAAETQHADRMAGELDRQNAEIDVV
jgi:hypothetical protein